MAQIRHDSYLKLKERSSNYEPGLRDYLSPNRSIEYYEGSRADIDSVLDKWIRMITLARVNASGKLTYWKVVARLATKITQLFYLGK